MKIKDVVKILNYDEKEVNRYIDYLGQIGKVDECFEVYLCLNADESDLVKNLDYYKTEFALKNGYYSFLELGHFLAFELYCSFFSLYPYNKTCQTCAYGLMGKNEQGDDALICDGNEVNPDFLCDNHFQRR